MRPHFLLLVALLAAIIGCQPPGPPVATVTGTVTLAGAPVKAGVVMFQSEDGTRNVMTELVDGRFEMKTYDAAGIAPGRYKVALKPPPPKYDTPPLADAAINDPRPVDKTIPARYYTFETSGLTADVSLDKPNDFKFELRP